MIGREHYFFSDISEMDDKEIISGFIKQYYVDKNVIPSKIMIREEIEDLLSIEKWLSEKADKKVIIKTPKKGEKLKFVEMAEKNAKITLENKAENEVNVIEEIKEILKLPNIPRKIESFDISNISRKFYGRRNGSSKRW